MSTRVVVLSAVLAGLVGLSSCSEDKPSSGTGPADVTNPADVTALEDTGSDAEQTEITGPCTDGELACFTGSTTKICVAGEWKFKDSCTEGQFCYAGKCAEPITCTPGELLGCSGYAQEDICADTGKAKVATKCKGIQQCVAGKCQDVVCTPGISTCDGNGFKTCKDDGQGYTEVQSCKTGATCLGGQCVSLCESNIKISNNVGCQYWSVDLDNDRSSPPIPNKQGVPPEMIPHTVVITNPGIADAEITFTIMSYCPDGTPCQPSITTCNGKKSTVCDKPGKAYPLAIADNVVKAGGSKAFDMPVMNVPDSGIVRKGIFVQSTQPVVAYQFNPYNSEGAASNDGSLLLPVNTLGKTYFAVSKASRGAVLGFPANYGFVTIVASSVGKTTVTVTPRQPMIVNPALEVPQDGSKPASLAAGTAYTFELEQYEILNLSHLPELKALKPGEQAADITGTRIDADKPVAVFSGHQASGVLDDIKSQFTDEWDTCCTEHLEEQLMPLATWGTEAICIKTKPRGYEIDEWVVVAGDDAVTLSTTPKINGLDGKQLAKAGDKIRVQTDESFVLTATGRIQVVQYTVGHGMTQPKTSGVFTTGDPTMLLIPPAKQFRSDYVVQTADGYGTNWLTIVRPKGVDVQLDGNVLSGGNFDGVGNGDWEYAYIEVQKGTHKLESKQPFGLSVYGYGGVTAYGYPGGMNLQ
jgi:hypothetical protein